MTDQLYHKVWKPGINTDFTQQTNNDRPELRLFGCCRVVWNDALAFCRSAQKLPGYNKLSALLTQSKKTQERQWLKDVSSVSLQQSLRHDVAYRNFFNSRNGKHKGKKSGLPKLQEKDKQAIGWVHLIRFFTLWWVCLPRQNRWY